MFEIGELAQFRLRNGIKIKGSILAIPERTELGINLAAASHLDLDVYKRQAITIAFKADCLVDLKTLAGQFLQILQPIGMGGDAGVVHGHAIKANLCLLYTSRCV